MRALSRLSLRAKLMLATVLLIASVLALVISLVSHSMRQVIHEMTRQRGIAIAQIFGSGTNLTHLQTYNYRMLQVNAQSAKRESRLVYAIVYDKEGKVAAHSEDGALINTNPSEKAALQSLQAEEPLFRQLELPSPAGSPPRRVFDFSVPVRTPEPPGRWGTVRLGFSTQALGQPVRETQMRILMAGLAAVVAGIVGAYCLANRITNPVSEIVRGALTAAGGDLSHRIQLRTGDELEGLANNFNYMMDQIRHNQEERIKAEKLAAVGTMVSTIVHDCRTPITVIKGFASVLSDFDVSAQQKRECLAFIRFEVERMQRMLDEILLFAAEKKTSLSLETCPLNPFLQECCIEIKQLFRGADSVFVQDLNCDALVAIDKDKMRRALLNIAVNAKEALKNQGTFRFSAEMKGNQACIRLADNGGGIPEQLREKIFQPFFTQGKSQGFGLGMSITKKIVDDHSGKITMESKVGQGTTFVVSIPVAPTTPQASLKLA